MVIVGQLSSKGNGATGEVRRTPTTKAPKRYRKVFLLG
jgi:hypothetical protein